MFCYDIQLGSSGTPLLFLMIDSTDHITGKTGLSPTVTISKNGAAFASPAGAVTQLSSGWYQVAGNATDTNTLGPLLLHATATGADPTDVVVAQILAYNPQSATNLGLTNLDATVSSRSTLTQAQILSDATPFPGARIDAAISTRSTLTQAQILSDAIPFPGARIDAAISSRSTLTQAQILSDVTPFPGADIDAAISSRAPASTALSNATWTNAKAAQIDANISSRATPTQIVSDGIAFPGADIDTTISSRAPASTALSSATWTSARAAALDNVLAWKIKKATALANFAFLMVQSADHISPATGLSVTVQRSLDGGAFVNSTSSPAIEIGSGVYKINLSAADLTADIVVLKCTATGADQRTIVIATEP